MRPFEGLEDLPILRLLRAEASRVEQALIEVGKEVADAGRQVAEAEAEADRGLPAQVVPLEAEIARLRERIRVLRAEARAQGHTLSAPHRYRHMAASSRENAKRHERGLIMEATRWARAASRAQWLTSVQVSRVLMDAYDTRLAKEGFLRSRGRNADPRSYSDLREGWALRHVVLGKGAPVAVCQYLFRLASRGTLVGFSATDSMWENVPTWQADKRGLRPLEMQWADDYFIADSPNGKSRIQLIQSHARPLPESPAKEALLRLLPGPAMVPGPTPFQMQTAVGRLLYSTYVGACYRPGWSC